MDKENKYQVIDPDSEKYKLTAQDIINDKKAVKKKKRRKKLLIAFISIFLVFAIVIGSVAFIANDYMNKMNYGDSIGEINPEIDKEESLSFDEQSDADADIRANLDDNMLWYHEDVYNVLLVGVDYGDRKDGEYANYLTRSDSMILLSINKKDNVINMVSLSRAAYVAIPGYGNKRLNAAHAYGGAKLLVETIEKNYKIRIDKYVTINFDGFQSVVDALGGVSIDLTAQEALNVLGKSKAGTYTLDGEDAMAYVRLRSIDSDRMRTGRQRAVLNAMAAKLRGASFAQLRDLLEAFLPLVTTNFTKGELLEQMTKVPGYLSMPIHEDIIPYKALPLALRDGKEVLILDWEATNAHTHDLLYPGMVPQTVEN